MFYRVDLLLAAMVAGVILAAVVGRHAARRGRGYLGATLAVVAANAVLFTVGGVFGYGEALGWVSGIIGVFASMLVGAAALLRGPDVLYALRLSTGVGFISSALGKAFAMDFMVGFFAQSGYSIGFLRFIMVAEVIGGVALLLPWMGLALVAAAGLAVDMFGAIVTHVHNGDPLNDSTGAISMLIRLALITVLAVSQGRRLSVRGLVPIALFGAAALAAAIAGAMGVRGKASPVAAAGGPFERLVGIWHCAGTFAGSGKPILADLHVDLDADLGGVLLFRHDDRPPNRYHALGEWQKTPTGLVATIQDSFGGLRVFRSPGWQGKELVWDGGTVGATPTQRFVYEDRGQVELGIRYLTLTDSVWQLGDSSTCTRAR